MSSDGRRSSEEGRSEWACGNKSSIQGLWLKLPQRNGRGYWMWEVHNFLGESWGNSRTKAEAPFVCSVHVCVRALQWGLGTAEELAGKEH